MNVLRFIAPLALLAPAFGGTWIVDDDGGPGVDFTDIQAAIDAAATGDVILVSPGLYKYFTLDRALVLIGEPGAIVNWATTSWVSGIQSGDVAVVAGIEFVSSLYMWNCSVPVVIDSVKTGGAISVSGSSDVRVRDCLADGMGAGPGSRLEVSESASYGPNGWYGYPMGGPGGNGLVCNAGSVVHAYRSVFVGGSGGGSDEFNAGVGGDGGDGVGAAGELLLAGDPLHTVSKGYGGYPSGYDGIGLKLTGSAVARISGVSIDSTSAAAGTTLVNPAPGDPALRILAPAVSGGAVTFRVHTVPGATVALNMGRFATVSDVPGPLEDLLVVVLRVFNLGSVNGSGVAGLNFNLPGYLPPGFVFFAQARVTLPGGETRYSNSVPVVLR